MSATTTLADALRLVVILDAGVGARRDLAALGAQAAEGGATLLQVRAKQAAARDLADLVHRVMAATPLPIVVNDRLDVALATGAAGCHLGQVDFPIDAARAMAPAGFWLGGSAGTPEEAARAAAAGAHYLGIGAVAATASKADAGAAIGAEGFRRVHAAAPAVPAVAIGGVTAALVPALMAAGASGVAVIRAVLDAPDPVRAARDLRAAVGR
ncbi:MAG TPA: thiamine phosphate synthase [Gemmatimonadales bacterium]|nr:thiamine phosphate synthase [Gemmatimonadales bacterium]